MKARIHIITLAVDDLDRSLRFYRNLGLDSPGIMAEEIDGDEQQAAGAVVMFKLANLTLALYPRSDLSKDAKVPLGPAKSGEFSIGQIVASRKAVDAVLEQAKSAGATIVDPAHERPWGIYSGYFCDLDGHLWEIIHDP